MSRRSLIAKILALPVLAGLGVLLYASSLSPNWQVDKSELIPAKAAGIFSRVVDLHEWASWTAWGPQRDPTQKVSYSGPKTGSGAEMRWEGEEVGRGKLRIISVQENKKVIYQLWFEDAEEPGQGSITLQEQGESTKVTWTGAGNMQDNLIGRLFIPKIQEAVGKDFTVGLANLKKLAEEGKLSPPAPSEP